MPASSPGVALAAAPVVPAPVLVRGRRGWFPQLLLRLHFYAGLLVGPFILVAAISGGLYAIAPSVEQVVYDRQLHAPVADAQLTLAEQIRAAQAAIGSDATPSAVRPAPEPGDTTRVMFADPELGSSESRAVFVDPGSGEIRGELTAYGTSGALPLRTWIDQLHRSLHLGEFGRFYSELAASWLGIVALVGLGLWVVRFRRARVKRDLLRPNRSHSGVRGVLGWHAAIGIWVVLGALFLSATGITWSAYAGTRVSELRTALAWGTPTLDTALGSESAAPDAHAQHHGGASAAPQGAADPAAFDTVLAIGKRISITTGQVEIRPPAEPGTAWVIREIKTSFPTEVDALAIDGSSLRVVDRVDFADYPLAAKLARWGIDLHMGALFGVANQIVLLGVAAGIASLVILGYRMWWLRRPTRGDRFALAAGPERGAVGRAPWWGIAAVLAGGAAIGMLLPLVGWTLVVWVLLDLGIGALRRRRARGAS